MNNECLMCFEPLLDYRWVVRVDGIPAYIVRSVELPSFKDGVTQPLKLVLYNTTEFGLTLEDAKAIKLVEVEYLHTTGYVARATVFHKVKLCLFETSKLDYASDELLLTNVHFNTY